jgi:signal transduction histidine kinase/CheY-like chemotaxis protein/HPt (histidine-containing phosphotransfer) domain-containing protein
VIGLYALRAVLLGAVFVILLLAVLRVQADTTRTHDASSLAIDAVAVDRSASDLQASMRGYLLARRPSYLGPYSRARAALPAELAALRRGAINASQRAVVRQIGGELNAYVSGVTTPLVAGIGHTSHAHMLAMLARGDVLVNSVRSHLGRLESAAQALRRQRRSNLNSLVTLVGVLALLGLVLSLSLDFWLTSFLLRSILRPIRSVARAAASMARGNLDTRVPAEGRGEVALLANSFNEMAESTQARTGELASTQERLGRALAVAEEASAMKSNFVANMSHEIRTPLNGLVGMLSLLSETELDEEQRKYVDVALSSSDALMHVVGDVLDIAKIEAGRMELEWIDFDLHEAVESVCDLMAAAARAKRLELQSFVHEDVPRAVRGDRTRICQILQNLVSNAVKFTPAGEVAVEVTLASQDPETIKVRFDVRDSGIGIEPQRVGQLFEPFTQAELGTTRKFGGTGLGLAISRELTQIMHGTISGESSLGRGSTFSFEIPFQPARAELPVPVPAADLSGVRVLVVDDNATNRRVFQSYVAGWGMRALATAGAHDAVTALRDAARAGDPFQIALIDLNLEGESGLDLARKISEAPELDGTRLIMLTSSAGSRPDDPSFGIARRLAKPVRRARLLEAISTVLGRGAPAPAVKRGGLAEAPAESPAAGPPRASAGPPSAPAADSEEALPKPAAPAGERGRILVAEDHDVNWMLIERMLSVRGHTVERAVDGEAVLEMLGERDYDLVLMDCQMPVRDGYDTTRELRRRGAQARNGQRPLPVVAMTASALDETRQKCTDAGMDGYLGKPIVADELERVLTSWLPDGLATGGHVDEPAEPESESEPAAELSRDGITLQSRQLDQLRRIYPGERLVAVINELADEVGEDLAELTAGIEARDQVRVAAAAHRIRNTGRVLGSQQLADAAAELDQPPQDGQPPVVFDAGVVERLRELWGRVQEALSELSAS